MQVLITGADGFIGKNLQLHLQERKTVSVRTFTRANVISDLPALLDGVDFVFHLAGINRPKDPADFVVGNADLTLALCQAIAAGGRKIPVVYTSSTQALLENPYGASKRAAEQALERLSAEHNNPVYIYRLPNVFGKWARPNYNSAVATFCHNIARDLPIQINDPAARVNLVYVDDVVEGFLAALDGRVNATPFAEITPQYAITVGEMADLIRSFKGSRNTLITERVGTGLVRALYSTYVSYLPVETFSYDVPMHTDPRGTFVEMLKTPDAGQFSFFTAHSGVTRGGHYHHSKTEKFLVIKGVARFKFRHMLTGETYELVTRGDKAQIVETVPGWTHDITNIGEDELVVMLWANEIFDREKPDTFACPV